MVETNTIWTLIGLLPIFIFIILFKLFMYDEKPVSHSYTTKEKSIIMKILLSLGLAKERKND